VLKLPYRKNLKEFLVHGVKYAFPARPGEISKGMPTAHSAQPLQHRLRASGPAVVWPSRDGDMEGQSLKPLSPNVPHAAQQNPKLYECLALIDAIRIGKPRERKIAIEELAKRL
jgi:hypothetical protein